MQEHRSRKNWAEASDIVTTAIARSVQTEHEVNESGCLNQIGNTISDS
jgi:hypothetical protein